MSDNDNVSRFPSPNWHDKEKYENFTDLERDLMMRNQELEQRIERLTKVWYALGGLLVACGVVIGPAILGIAWKYMFHRN